MVPICIHCDSQAAIGSHNSVRQLLSSGIITIDYVKSKDNLSDPLTKGLTKEGVDESSTGMGLWPRTSHRGGNST